MFGVPQEELSQNLRKLSTHLCAYSGGEGEHSEHCDCKYGVTELGYTAGEHNGCPETLMASKIIRAMSFNEFKRVCKRAGIMV